MKYAKKIKKHFEFISNKDYLQDCASNLSTVKCSSALLEGLCCHFFTGEDPFQRVKEVKNTLINALPSEIIITTRADVNFYTYVLSALCAYKQTTKNTDADQSIEKVANPLFNALAKLINENGQTKQPAKVFCALNVLCDYCLLLPNGDIAILLKTLIEKLLSTDFNATEDNCFDYLTTCLGGLKYAKLTNENAVNEYIARLFDNFMLKAQSLNYASAISFANLKETSPSATARSLEVALALYANLLDNRYLTLAKRIWFNGMQFCQREKGQVGTDVFTTEQNSSLKVARYEIKQIATPLYAIGLKCFAGNKHLFEEAGELFKDRRGRYFLGDKMFGRDLSGFFGRDLIEIPTLTAFDSQTAMQLDLKLVF